MSIIVCRPRTLPLDLLPEAARRAVEINPENDVGRRSMMVTPPGKTGGLRRLALVVSKRWPSSGVRLSVSFMDNPSAALRARILLHMNAWGEWANVVFSETKNTGEVRIARLDSPDEMAGYWSHVGTDIRAVPTDEPTLNLEAFTMKTSEAEFRRVVRHEAGHTLGFDHEHMRSAIVAQIDRKKAFAYFDRTVGWPKEEVLAQVLTPLADKSLMGTTESDPLSIMCYELPGSIMKTGRPVKGGSDINAKDAEFAAKVYPKKKKAAETAVAAPLEPPAVLRHAPPEEDVDTFHLIVLDEFKPDTAAGSAGPRPEFAQVLASYAGARVTSPLRLRGGAGGKTLWGSMIGMQRRLRAYTNGEKGTLPEDAEMMQFGVQLFQTLLQGDVRRLYDEARSRQRRRRLDLVLTSMIPWISEMPWEFAYDAGRQTFLATEEIHFVRNVLTSIPADPVILPKGPLRILVAAAQPVGFGRLSVDQEVAVIRRGFQGLIDQRLIEIEVLPRATPGAIHEALSVGGFHVAHFIGHGVYDEQKQQGCLVFENDRGGRYLLGQREVREIFCKRGLSLVFLNACESGRGGRADFNKGVAQSLVAHGLPALVANQYSVLDSKATEFARQFYRSVALGLSVGEAAREARIAVNYSMFGEPIDWAVPVLYARDPGMTLCATTTTPRPDAIALRSKASPPSRRSAGKLARVAVCDVDDAFPGLERTLDAMNAAQERFGFGLANVSMPLDVWHVDPEEGVSFLWAEKLAHRLQNKAAQLDVDVVVCLTRHWLRDDDWKYLYAWWPGGRTPPVLVFSVAGFDQLEPEGLDTDRAIANAMVSGLAGFFGDVGSHASGAKNCPLSFNGDRNIKYVTGPLKFDPSCRRKLSKTLGPRMAALDELLKVFAK